LQRKIALVVGAILIGVIGGVYGVSTVLTIDSSAESLTLVSWHCDPYPAVVVSIQNNGQTTVSLTTWQTVWSTGQSEVYSVPWVYGQRGSDLSAGQTGVIPLSGVFPNNNVPFAIHLTTARGHIFTWNFHCP
jgi:hypothetical protein